MNEKVLEEIGLSKNESKVFLTLLELGATTAGKIAEKSAVHRTNVYDALERLTEKGLVAHVTKGKTTVFEATDPRILMNTIKEKETKLQSIMPQLLLSKQMATEKSEAHIYEGIIAVRNILNHFLEIGQTRYAYGAPKLASEMIGNYFLENYHRRRVKQKIGLQLIYNNDAKKRIHFLNKQQYTESKYLEPEYDSPVTTCVCGGEVVMILYQKNPLVIQIKNPDIAKAYKKYFDLLWKLAKKK